MWFVDKTFRVYENCLKKQLQRDPTKLSLVLCVFLSVFHTYRLYVYRVVNKCRCNNINNCIGPTEDFITLTKTRSISIKMTAYYQGLTQKTIHNTNTETLFSLMLMNKHKL